jgi:phage terminase large subunit GpA-like protein
MRRKTLSLPLAKWIAKNICLPEGLCAVPGPMRLYAYQCQMADALTDPAFERVTIQKAARVGLTSILSAAIGFWCAEQPAPILLLLPTEADARDYVVSDLEPLFAESPALAAIFALDHVGQRGRPAKGLPQRNTILSRRFGRWEPENLRRARPSQFAPPYRENPLDR